MKTIVPDYYEKFHCIASSCRHNCCIGWEIDIDENTEQRYLSCSRSSEDAMAKDFRENVRFSSRRQKRNGRPSHFILKGPEERCPFLTEEGLCRIILEKSERWLSQVCTDHPRFRNFYPDHVELGLGLTCEEACRVVLSEEKPVTYHYLSEPGEEAENSGETAAVPEYVRCVLPESIRRFPEGKVDWADWADFFLSLERLDDEWTALLTDLMKNPGCPSYEAFSEASWQQVLANFRDYLLYRHFMEYGHDFCELLWNLVIRLSEVQAAKKGTFTFADFAEIVRLYSGEIEYSDENRDMIMSELED